MLTLLASGNCQQSLVLLDAMVWIFTSPSKSIYTEMLTPKDNDIEGGALGRFLHPERGTVIPEETPERSLPLLPCENIQDSETQRKVYNQPASRNVRNEFLLSTLTQSMVFSDSSPSQLSRQVCTCCCYVASVMSDSVRPRPHRQKPTRLPGPWASPGKNTGVGCHFLLQCMKVKSEREVAQSCLTLSNPMGYSLPGSSVYGIVQARVLEWGASAFSAGLQLHHPNAASSHMTIFLLYIQKVQNVPKGWPQLPLYGGITRGFLLYFFT